MILDASRRFSRHVIFHENCEKSMFPESSQDHLGDV